VERDNSDDGGACGFGCPAPGPVATVNNPANGSCGLLGTRERGRAAEGKLTWWNRFRSACIWCERSSSGAQTGVAASSARAGTMAERLPELIGNAACMIE